MEKSDPVAWGRGWGGGGDTYKTCGIQQGRGETLAKRWRTTAHPWALRLPRQSLLTPGDGLWMDYEHLSSALSLSTPSWGHKTKIQPITVQGLPPKSDLLSNGSTGYYSQ